MVINHDKWDFSRMKDCFNVRQPLSIIDFMY